MSGFSEFNLCDGLMEGLSAMGYEAPTAIQRAAIPLVLAGRDLIGCAQTGTGKTAAFVLPVLHRLATQPEPRGGSQVLIIAPTRELVMQIDQQIEGLGYFTGVSSRAIYGGNDGGQWGLQRHAVDSGADILVATPGRLIQFMQLGIATFEGINTLILDEADRMLDMGFLPDIQKIVKALPKERQTLFFSATMPPEVRRLSKNILHDPESISIAVSKPAERIKQYKIQVDEGAKIGLLTSLLRLRTELQSIIIFAEKKVTCRDLARSLRTAGLDVAEIHADLEQDARELALQGFKSRRTRILVATDILARGIDIEDVDVVINFNVPQTPEQYVHRVGRTARAESDGESLTLASPREARALHDIEHLLGAPIPIFPPLEGLEIPPLGTTPEPAPIRREGGRGRGPRGGGRPAGPNRRKGKGPRPGGKSQPPADGQSPRGKTGNPHRKAGSGGQPGAKRPKRSE